MGRGPSLTPTPTPRPPSSSTCTWPSDGFTATVTLDTCRPVLPGGERDVEGAVGVWEDGPRADPAGRGGRGRSPGREYSPQGRGQEDLCAFTLLSSQEFSPPWCTPSTSRRGSPASRCWTGPGCCAWRPSREEGGPLAHVALFLFGLFNETCAKAGERWLGHKLSSGNKEEVPKLGAPWQGRRPPTAHPGSRSPSACSRPGRRPSCGSCCRGATGPLWSSAGTGTAGVRPLPHPLSTLAGGGADRDLDRHQGRVSALNPPSLPVYLTRGPCPPVLGV